MWVRCLPMLPESLSNGLCSLNPQVDRLALVCEMHVSKAGNVTRFRVAVTLACRGLRSVFRWSGAARIHGDG